MKSEDILLAQIGGPHGVRGEVRVKPFGDPDMLGAYGPLHDSQGRTFVIAAMRPQKSVLVVRFKGIDTREAAEALNGRELYVARSALPETDADEYYLTDLIGLVAVTPEGEAAGTVTGVEDFGAGDVIEIRLANGRSELFAFTRETFPQIDIAAGRITFVEPPSVSERDEGRPER